MQIMNAYRVLIFLLMIGTAYAGYPYWPEYSKTPLAEIRLQKWRDKGDVIEGWDWSLPPNVKPAPNGLMAVKRSSSLDRSLTTVLEPLDIPINPTVTLWIKWGDLEPEEGKYRFAMLRKRIEEAEAMSYSVVLRLLCSATSFAPEWIKNYDIPIRAEHKPAKVKNYDISNPHYRRCYLRLIHKLGESGIPRLNALKGAFVGYASPSYGDEGIGPHGVDPDTVPHVIKRLDAWAKAFEGVEHKVFMGGVSRHGLDLGFGIRRGFVEMYLYHIPDDSIGQRVDNNGYLWVDESVQILSKNVFHGEENEEYEEKWATAARDFRFGKTTVSYPYRYFTSNLRLLQMRCSYVLYNSFSIMPEQLIWVGQNLARTVEDAPDIWCALRESYVRKVGPVKNFERWLYQRDSEGFETQPAVKIEQPIQMWMVEPGKYYDYIGRQGQQIGFAVDDRWCGGASANVAIKATYFDIGRGTVDVIVRTKTGPSKRSINLTGIGDLKTATFFFNDVVFSAKGMNYDIIFKSTGTDAVLSFVRVIKLDRPGVFE
ncbi:MAG: hypothetical protein GY774_28375 [Planctomycetes bacterium]|nr:hypothetical protein [Planctomycetota bacterium]